MSHDNVFALKNPAVPNTVRDVLTEVLREGARTLLAQAIEAEVAEFLAGHAEKRDAGGRARLVRNGHPTTFGLRVANDIISCFILQPLATLALEFHSLSKPQMSNFTPPIDTNLAQR
jgi:hypothetical protein